MSVREEHVKDGVDVGPEIHGSNGRQLPDARDEILSRLARRRQRAQLGDRLAGLRDHDDLTPGGAVDGLAGAVAEISDAHGRHCSHV